jgi:hypothetical protein
MRGLYAKYCQFKILNKITFEYHYNVRIRVVSLFSWAEEGRSLPFVLALGTIFYDLHDFWVAFYFLLLFVIISFITWRVPVYLYTKLEIANYI